MSPAVVNADASIMAAAMPVLRTEGCGMGIPVHSRLEAVAIMSDNAGGNKHIAVQQGVGASGSAPSCRDEAVNPDKPPP